ncbi:hypothetical protein DRQ07_03070 [candidate division KSB1 bacterium]|nr:MAG: hypothetical protein DRQ07_03070 [candidate division KSB1 bacterium]
MKIRYLSWILFILHCANDTYYTGMTRDLEEELDKLKKFKKGRYFRSNPNALPFEVVYLETNLPFIEAYNKFRYMRKMNKRQKLKLIRTKKWPIRKRRRNRDSKIFYEIE